MEKCLGVRLLIQRANIYSVLLDIAEFSTIGLIEFCIPRGNIWEWIFPYNPVNILNFCQTKKWELLFTRALICTSLIMSGVYHVFVCLRLIGTSF